MDLHSARVHRHGGCFYMWGPFPRPPEPAPKHRVGRGHARRQREERLRRQVREFHEAKKARRGLKDAEEAAELAASDQTAAAAGDVAVADSTLGAVPGTEATEATTEQERNGTKEHAEAESGEPQAGERADEETKERAMAGKDEAGEDEAQNAGKEDEEAEEEGEEDGEEGRSLLRPTRTHARPLGLLFLSCMVRDHADSKRDGVARGLTGGGAGGVGDGQYTRGEKLSTILDIRTNFRYSLAGILNGRGSGHLQPITHVPRIGDQSVPGQSTGAQSQLSHAGPGDVCLQCVLHPVSIVSELPTLDAGEPGQEQLSNALRS